MIKDYDFEDPNFFKKRDKQLEKFRLAQDLEKNGKSEEAIKIVEKIMYEESIMVDGKWPMMLANLYFKNKLYDQCYRHLNMVNDRFILNRVESNDMQAKIHKIEGRHNDALLSKIFSLIYKSSSYDSKEIIEKNVLPYIKRANLLEKKENIILLIQEFVKTKPAANAYICDGGGVLNKFKILIGRE